jgi:hypothetical protein
MSHIYPCLLNFFHMIYKTVRIVFMLSFMGGLNIHLPSVLCFWGEREPISYLLDL